MKKQTFNKLEDLFKDNNNLSANMLCVAIEKKINNTNEKSIEKIILILLYKEWCYENKFQSCDDVKNFFLKSEELIDCIVISMGYEKIRGLLLYNNLKIIVDAVCPFEDLKDVNFGKCFMDIIENVYSRKSIIKTKDDTFESNERKKKFLNIPFSDGDVLKCKFDIFLFDDYIQGKAKLCYQDIYLMPKEIRNIINCHHQYCDQKSVREYEKINVLVMNDILKKNNNFQTLSYHEVITQKKPLKFYLDIDKMMTSLSSQQLENGDVNEYSMLCIQENEMLQILNCVICEYVFEILHHLQISYETISINNLILDSSNVNKFSRHIICNITVLPQKKDFYFHSKDEILFLVKKIIESCLQKNNTIANFIDLQVYSLNRNFRTIFSSKIEPKNNMKARILLPIKNSYTKFTNHVQQWFKSNNLLNTDLYVLDKLDLLQHIRSFSEIDTVITSSFITSNNKPFIKSVIINTIEHPIKNYDNSNTLRNNNDHKTIQKSNNKHNDDDYYVSKTTLNNPQNNLSLQKLFEILISDDTIKNKDIFADYKNFRIKKVLLNESFFKLYISTKNSTCYIANRTHISNNVWFLLDIHAGSLVQKCFDQECKYGNNLIFSQTTSSQNITKQISNITLEFLKNNF